MRSKRSNLGRRLVFLGIEFFCCVTLAAGQIAGGLTETTNARLGGNNYIVGMVFSPEGEPIKTRTRIRLSSPTAGDILGTTDDSGKFVFSGLGSGTYMVFFDGDKEFQTAVQQVDVIRRRSTVPETYSVTIRLRYLDKSKTEKPSVIDASNVGVPKSAMALYQDASKLTEAKDYKGAIEKLKLAVVAYPKFVNALNQIGVLYLRLNELNNADEVLQAALKIKPDAYEPLLNRGIALLRLQRLKEAEDVLRSVLKIKPESPSAYYYLGRTLHRSGRNEEAETAYLLSVKSGPGQFKEVHRLLAALYLERGVLNRVVEELETYLRLVPDAADSNNLRHVIEQSKLALAAPRPVNKP